MQREGMDTKSPATLGGLARAALLGLSGGMVLGGLFLLGLGLKTRLSPADCTNLSEMECTFTQEAAIQMSRMQSVAGAALLALGAAVVVLMRSKARSVSR